MDLHGQQDTAFNMLQLQKNIWEGEQTCQQKIVLVFKSRYMSKLNLRNFLKTKKNLVSD